MYEELCKSSFNSPLVWMIELGMGLGKSREECFKDWYILNVKLPPDYSFNAQNTDKTS